MVHFWGIAHRSSAVLGGLLMVLVPRFSRAETSFWDRVTHPELVQQEQLLWAAER